MMIIDTNLDEAEAEPRIFATGERYDVTSRSLLLFSMVAETESAKDTVQHAGT